MIYFLFGCVRLSISDLFTIVSISDLSASCVGVGAYP